MGKCVSYSASQTIYIIFNYIYKIPTSETEKNRKFYGSCIKLAPMIFNVSSKRFQTLK